MATDKGKLLCFDGRRLPHWEIPLSYGPLIGAPWEARGQLLLASAGGVVCRLDAATGKELGKAEAGSLLGCGPVEIGGRVFVAASDGCICEVPTF